MSVDLADAADLHCHFGPDAHRARSVDAFTAAREAAEAGHRALGLSPIDPLRYYYESLMGSCEFGAGNLQEAIRWCEASRRRNRQHLSTLRILISAYAESGQSEEASAIAEALMKLRPGYRVQTYEANSVAVLYPFGQRIARAMREAGVP